MMWLWTKLFLIFQIADVVTTIRGFQVCQTIDGCQFYEINPIINHVSLELAFAYKVGYTCFALAVAWFIERGNPNYGRALLAGLTLVFSHIVFSNAFQLCMLTLR